MLKKVLDWVERNEGIILLLLLVVVLRIPSLYEPYWYGDEGIYLVLGQGLKKGLVFYRDIHDNKPPLLYILAAIAGSVFWFRLMLMVWFGVATVMFFRLMQVLFPKNRKAWYVSSLVMIWLTTLAEGNIANAEIFIVLPVVAGMLMAWQERKRKKVSLLRWTGIGMVMAVGVLLKVPAGFDWLAIVLWLGVFEKKRLKEVWGAVKDKRIWGLVLGLLIPVGLSVAYYAKVGGGERYVRSALMQNIGYLTSWSTGEHSASGFASQSGLMMRTGILGVSLAGFYLLAKRFKLSLEARLIVVWFLMAGFGALLSERPYPHYLIQPAVPAAIMVSFFLWGRKKALKLVILGAGLLAGMAYYQIRFWHYPILAYYGNFGKRVLGKISREEYRSFFDWRVNQSYQVADYIRKRTSAGEKIFIWGDEPYIYALAERLPVGRYAVAYHVVDFNGYEETMEAWDRSRPAMVVVMEYEKREFPEMMGRLATDYALAEKIDQAWIYTRVNGVKNHKNN